MVSDVLTAATKPISLRDAVHAAAPRTILLIAAGTVHDEQLAAEHIRSGSPSTVDVWVVDGAGHTGGLRARPSEWAQRVIRFLDGGLLG